MLNNWDEKRVAHYASGWGRRYPEFISYMYDEAIKSGKSYLDLGCGFGRFLRYLNKRVKEPNYIGYDSSKFMIKYIKKRFPKFSANIFQSDITKPIKHSQETVLISAVFIHLDIEKQKQVLRNILNLSPQPKTIIFDTAGFDSKDPNKKKNYTTEVRKGDFLRVVQDIGYTLKFISKLAPNYFIDIKRFIHSKLGIRDIYTLTKIKTD